MVSLASPSNFMKSWRREGAGRTLTSTLGKIGLPLQTSRTLARATKIALAPVDYLSRRTGSSRPMKLRVPKDRDYTFLAHDQIPELDTLKGHCESVFAKNKESALAATKAPHSLFSYNTTPNGPEVVEVDDMRPIVDFLSQPDLVDMAVDYIGEIPVLGNICLWYSRTGSDRLGPQNIHRDMNCRRQLHIVLPLRPIDLGTGPFTFWPGDLSRDVIGKINHVYGRFEDDEFFKIAGRDTMIPFTSDRGAGLVINPYACFHFGGRAETTPRFVLICSYTSRFENAEEGLGTYRLVNRERFSDGSPLRRRLLNL